jgi:peptidoglycan/LPS O-acetylase OafA/YrhL
MVMLQHAMEATGLEIPERTHFALIWLNLGETGVVAFFFVSGFVIPLSLEKWNSVPHFWLNRAFRIYPMYIFTYLAGLLLIGSPPLSAIPANFAEHLFFIQGFFNTANFVPVAWTLGLEAVWYFVFTLAFVLSLNRNIPWLVVFSSLTIVAGCTLSLTGMVRTPMGRVDLLVICVLGLLCLRRELGNMAAKAFVIALTFLSFFVAAGLFVGFNLRPSDTVLTPTFRCVAISWLLGAALFLIPFFRRSWFLTGNAPVRYLGKISYSIYLLHPLVISVMLGWLGQAVTGWFAIGLIMGLTVAVSHFTYRFIEYPAISLSHAIRLSKRSA